MSCHHCGRTGTDAVLVATDPIPTYLPHPCGYCQGGTEMAEADEPDDGLTCDPCKEWRCHECEGGACWHECPES